ncbi:hypothetical protein LJC68_03610 [Bacteroidales bacterium OttesenSCG-928-B11]|nr:hypothetical protein [Bacteroidales bacterium OttesenSCG-928-C03]MDL2311948.1 hypothetical protein [Bacteroidales bacterium OttesenSCG-928-B11]
MKIKTSIFLIITILCTHNVMNAESFIDKNMVERTTSALTKKSSLPQHIIERGVSQAAAFWLSSDGSKEEFRQFCEDHQCKTPQEKEKLFYRLCENFESILGHNNRVMIDLLMPTHVSGVESLPIDQYFGSYDGLAHLNDDMFNSKIAFIVILNFPHFTLDEKNRNGSSWSDLEWGYVRLGDLFTSRVPAFQQQKIGKSTADADNYISNYNIYMGLVWSDKNVKYWPLNPALISHWGLRDEIKSSYADKQNGLDKQRIIYNVMKRIVDQSIPEDVINNTEYIWYPSSNQTFIEVNNSYIEFGGKSENNIRYQHLLNIFNSIKATDEYYGEKSNYIDRKFDDEFEISVKETERLFHNLLSSPQVAEVSKLISKRLGRKLEPFDIWYDGFKNRSTMDQTKLDQMVMSKYPTKEAFANDLPRILTDLGFTPERARFICDHITVDASVGAGHAWEAAMRSDKARLRTRIGENGMDYKGYNIGIHEFGHNVEQTISLHNVHNYFLRGVPNTAFTEALAFTFQAKDLELLGIKNEDDKAEYLNTLDAFWGCYEIMGVAMVDIKVWQWMYKHPNATAAQLKNAVVQIAKDVWNQYYAPIFKKEDQTILGVYSHMIDAPLYLSAYPIGHLIDFQMENYLKGKNLGQEVERIFKIGRKSPNVWMKEAIGTELSVQPLLDATSEAVKKASAKK